MADAPVEISPAGSQSEKYGDDDSDSDLDIFTDALSFQDDPESTFADYSVLESVLPQLKTQKPTAPNSSVQISNEIPINLEALEIHSQYTQPEASTSANPRRKEDGESLGKDQLPQEYHFHSNPGDGSSSSSPQSSSYGSGSAIDNLINKHKKALATDGDSKSQLKIEDLVPIAPPVDPKIKEILSSLDSFDIYNFMWQFITDLSFTDPERRPHIVTSPALSNGSIVTILSEILESTTLEDVLDGWVYIWEFVIAPRLTEDEASEFVDIKSNYFAIPTRTAEGKGEGVQHNNERDEDGLMYFDDPDFQWPLKPTAEYKKLKDEEKKCKKDEKAVEKVQKKEDNIMKYKEFHAFLDASLSERISRTPWGTTEKEVGDPSEQKTNNSVPIPDPSSEITIAFHPQHQRPDEQLDLVTAVLDSETDTARTSTEPTSNAVGLFTNPSEMPKPLEKQESEEVAISRVAKRAFGIDGTRCLGPSGSKALNSYDLITLSEAVRRIAREADHKANCPDEH
ncbi:hypothetical protein TWF191_003635 [Orbilia oligospora]|uniref:Uncharacterized protein n=1 Tax=Orbilia oligospora TaxID=2813651 RepID=A0A7C8QX77_ORBOL|nr:hypothetical protein TWF679_010058 [Orbilia oligospora]KAF3227551.1 hypothetical protein TWF191_003635 [Orbilia oligospora]